MKYLLILNIKVISSGYYYDLDDGLRKDYRIETCKSVEVVASCTPNELQKKISDEKESWSISLRNELSREKPYHEHRVTTSLLQVVPLE